METSHLNTWLTAWAAVGPILTGAIAAWWSRRRQIQDRDYQSTQEQKRIDQARLDAEAELARNTKIRQLDWRRQTFIDFYSASHDLLWIGSGALEAETRERHRERFAKCYSTLMLLDPAIEREALAVWNCCQQGLALRGVTGTEAHESAARALREARAAFASKGQRLISDQIHGTNFASDAIATAESGPFFSLAEPNGVVPES